MEGSARCATAAAGDLNSGNMPEICAATLNENGAAATVTTASASAAATTRPWPSRLRRTLRAVELRRRRAGGHLLERTDVRGKVITRTTPATLITRRCGADHVFPVKGARNLRRHRPGDGWPLQGGKARLEQRVPLEDLINYPGQIARMLPQAAGKERQRRSERQRLHRCISSMRNTRRQRNCCGRGPWKT